MNTFYLKVKLIKSPKQDQFFLLLQQQPIQILKDIGYFLPTSSIPCNVNRHIT